MTPSSFDARWFFEQELALAGVFGQRFDVAGVARVSAPDAPKMAAGNRALVGPDDGLIPDVLVQVFDAQRRDGVTPRVEVYGARDERDDLCAEMGMVELPGETAAVRATSTVPPPHVGDERTAPDVVPVVPEAWVEACEAMHHGQLSPGERARLMCEALHPRTGAWGIRVGAAWVAAVARVELGEVARFSSVYCDADFRRTGFARACVRHALRATTAEIALAVMERDAADVIGLVRSFAPDVSFAAPRRRWVLAGEVA